MASKNKNKKQNKKKVTFDQNVEVFQYDQQQPVSQSPNIQIKFLKSIIPNGKEVLQSMLPQKDITQYIRDSKDGLVTSIQEICANIDQQIPSNENI